jgi:hypothetical protein
VTAVVVALVALKAAVNQLDPDLPSQWSRAWSSLTAPKVVKPLLIVKPQPRPQKPPSPVIKPFVANSAETVSPLPTAPTVVPPVTPERHTNPPPIRQLHRASVDALHSPLKPKRKPKPKVKAAPEASYEMEPPDPAANTDQPNS